MAEQAVSTPPDEFGAIRRYFQRPGLCFDRQGLVAGIGDDCALLSLEPGYQMAVSMDMLQEGIHFPVGADPFLLAQRALLVNLSDLAAMGAEPLGFTLGLSLPALDEAWLEHFSTGLAVVAKENECPLVGGDTTRGPLSLCIQVHGSVPAGMALRRSGARPGDRICVTGTLGDAAAALAMIEKRLPTGVDLNEKQSQHLLDAFYRPQSRVQAGLCLRGLATAAIDLSDGLASDLRHVLEASGRGARVLVDSLPMSDAFRAATTQEERFTLQVSGGDDYELCFTVAEEDLDSCRQALEALGVMSTCIGEITATPGLQWQDGRGHAVESSARGYRHFV